MNCNGVACSDIITSAVVAATELAFAVDIMCVCVSLASAEELLSAARPNIECSRLRPISFVLIVPVTTTALRGGGGILCSEIPMDVVSPSPSDLSLIHI